MSLQQCHDCGGKISSAAVACPHCGRPLREMVVRQTGELPAWLKMIVAILFVLVLFLVFI